MSNKQEATYGPIPDAPAAEVEELRAEVERLRRNTAGLYARAHAAEARLRRVEALAHDRDDEADNCYVHYREIRAALEAEPEVTPPAEQRAEGGA